MLLRCLYLLGTTLALGSVWFFAVHAIAEQVFALALSGWLLATTLGLSLAAGALVGWRLFFRPRRRCTLSSSPR